MPSTLTHQDVIDRDGVQIAYAVHGSGEPNVFLPPAWAISHSGIWAEQVEHLAPRHQVVTYDPRGNGRSSRPTDPSAHDPFILLGDALAVLDAVGVHQAIVVGNSYGTPLAFLLAALHPERVLGAVFINPSSLNLDGRTDDPFQQALVTFEDEVPGDEGWGRFNRGSWGRDFPGFLHWFIEVALPEPHAASLRDLGKAWAKGITIEQLEATILGRLAVAPAETAARLRGLVPRISCSTLVIHGELDQICPLHRSRTLAEHLGAPLVVVEGAAHCPQLTAPGRVNALLDDFIAGCRLS